MAESSQVWFSWKVVLPAIVLFFLGNLPPMWGLSSLWIADPASMGLVGLLAIICGIWTYRTRNKTPWEVQLPKPFEKWGIPLLMALVAGVLFSGFDMTPDPYGDARFIYKSLDYPVLEWDNKWLSDFFQFHPLDAKGGTNSIYTSVNLISSLFQIPGLQAFKALNLAFGMLFVGLWTHFVFRHLTRSTDRIHLMLAGLTSTCMLQYFGHFEVYGPPMALALLFFYWVVEVLENKSRLGKWLLLPVFLLNLKFHITAWLLFPGMALVYLYPYAVKSNLLKKLYQLKGMLLGIWLPMLVLATLVYVFVTDSVHGPRSYTEDTLLKVLFLPLDTPEGPPLDQYNLFSQAHLFDFLNIILLWSPVALATVLGLLLFGRKEIDWQRPVLPIMATAMLSYLGAFFLLNPLLGMTADWDLFSLPVPALLVLALVLVKARKPGGLPLLPAALVMSFFTGSFIVLNLMPSTRSHLLEEHGIHHYNTYYIGASTHFADAYALETDATKVEARLDRVIEKLDQEEPFENDIEYADLLMDKGKLMVAREGYTSQSLPYFQDAHAASPGLSSNIYELIVNHFMLDQYQEALVYCPELIEDCYPGCKKARRISIHTGVMAQAKSPTLQWCRDHLKAYPDDGFIKGVEAALANDQPWPQVQQMFKQQ